MLLAPVAVAYLGPAEDAVLRVVLAVAAPRAPGVENSPAVVHTSGKDRGTEEEEEASPAAQEPVAEMAAKGKAA